MIDVKQCYKKTDKTDILCNRCLSEKAKYEFGRMSYLCEDCYEFLIDLQEGGETISFDEIMNEG